MTLLRNLALLTFVMLAALAIGGWLAYTRQGAAGLQATIVAAGVNWFAASVALLCLERFRRVGQALSGILLGMLVRLGLPLAVGIILDHKAGDLSRAGVFGWIVVFYLIALIAETSLSVRILRHSRRPAGSI